jgi:hypothetical protein
MKSRNDYKKGEGMKKVEGIAMKYFLGYLVAIVMPCATIFGAAGEDVNTTTVGAQGGRDIVVNTQAPVYTLSCAGQGAVCNYAINAVGDLKEIDLLATTRLFKLGTITKPQTASVMVPRLDQQKMFTLSLSKPFSQDPLDVAMVGIPMEILLFRTEPDAEALKTSADAQSMIKVYRRMRGTGDMNELLWTEMATMVSDGNATPTPVVVVINPDGNAKLTVYGKEVVIFLGKAIVG